MAGAWTLLAAPAGAQALPRRPAAPQLVKLDPVPGVEPAEPMDPRSLDALVTSETRALACSRISHNLQALPAGRLNLAGFVGSAADKAALRDRLAMLIPRDEINDDDVVVRPWPQCEALQMFAQPLREPGGLAARLASARPEGTLRDDDRVVLDVTMPRFPAYLYVTYLQAGGDAVHLLQPRGRVPTPLTPSARLRIGEAPGAGFRVAEPFGSEMIVVLASASPLFAGERPASESERDYLAAFGRALAHKPPAARSGRSRTVAAYVVWLTTSKDEARR